VSEYHLVLQLIFLQKSADFYDSNITVTTMVYKILTKSYRYEENSLSMGRCVLNKHKKLVQHNACIAAKSGVILAAPCSRMPGTSA